MRGLPGQLDLVGRRRRGTARVVQLHNWLHGLGHGRLSVVLVPGWQFCYCNELLHLPCGHSLCRCGRSVVHTMLGGDVCAHLRAHFMHKLPYGGQLELAWRRQLHCLRGQYILQLDLEALHFLPGQQHQRGGQFRQHAVNLQLCCGLLISRLWRDACVLLRGRIVGKRHKLLCVPPWKLFSEPILAIMCFVSRGDIFGGQRNVMHAVSCRQYLLCCRVLVLQRMFSKLLL